MTIDGEIELIKLETWVTRAVSYKTHVALIDGLMIDSGFAHARQKLLGAIGKRPVEQLVNTHAHEDHAGNNAEIARRCGARLYAPAASLPALAEPARECRLPYQRIVWGTPPPSHPAPLGPTVSTRRFRFDVVPTPGHARDHVCFHEPQRGWLFGGDLFLGPWVKVARDFENGADLIASLERVLALAPRLFVCYHRGVVADPLPALRAKLDYLRELRHHVEREHAAGTTDEEIARRVLGKEPLRFVVITGGDFSKTKLVRALLKTPGQG